MRTRAAAAAGSLKSKGDRARFRYFCGEVLAMNWKPSILVPFLAAAIAPAVLAAQEPAPSMEVFATSRGNFVAWPAGMLEKTDALELAAQAEGDVTTTGKVSAATIGNLVIKTKSSPPRLAGPGSGGGRPVIKAMQLVVTGHGCDGAVRVCANGGGTACQPGQPGCRCACAAELATSAAAGPTPGRRRGPMLFVIAPSAAAAGASAAGALESMHRTGVFIKFIPY
jgi:hypothetical protein